MNHSPDSSAELHQEAAETIIKQFDALVERSRGLGAFAALWGLPQANPFLEAPREMRDNWEAGFLAHRAEQQTTTENQPK